MTLFGHDVSSYNPAYQPAAGTFHMVKCSEGAHTHDSEWSTLSARVRAAENTLLIAYHFLHSDSTPAAQAANTAEVPGIKGLPLMVDVEVEGTSKPTIAQCAAYVDEARRLGLNPRLVYLPKWYWEELGSPSLQPLIDRGLHLVSSAYPTQGHYPGDSGSGWQPYGGMTPLIWQYSSVPLDCDAYKGTLAQLTAVLGGTTPEDNMTPADLLNTPVPGAKMPNGYVPKVWELLNGSKTADTQLAAQATQIAALAATVKTLAALAGSQVDTAAVVAAVQDAIGKAVIHVEVESGPAAG
ncbi:GH25 family lysozyme [Streptacidiphilus cavernicola]|uniref:GH25 family lysozyme n=1 Tax=Streptacidiphilus cavernicola TaxID=3342716 RepID=A0ABV6VXZ5_9ACTN